MAKALNIQIDSGEKRITINDDPKRVLIFNPSDILFAEKFYNLVGDFDGKLLEFTDKMKEIEAEKEVDKNGIPLNAAERIAIQKETCQYIRDQIDVLFGKDTSDMLFGESYNLEVFAQFFEGITPFIKAARTEKVAQYTKGKTTTKSK